MQPVPPSSASHADDPPLLVAIDNGLSFQLQTVATVSTNPDIPEAAPVAIQPQPAAAIAQPVNRARRTTSISRIRAVRNAHTAGADLNYVIQEYPEDLITSLYLPDQERFAGRVFMACMKLLDVVEDTSPLDIIGIYASAICAVFSGVERTVRDALKQMGIGVEPVMLPSQAEAHFMLLPERCNFSAVLVMTGQLLLIPFKNISVASYDNFMFRIAQALRTCTGCFIEANVTDHLNRRQAEIIKSGIGSLLTFKRELLIAINSVSGGTGTISNMCKYLLEIISWTGMAAFVFIHDTLLVPNSPVLRDPRVATEIRNLCTAYKAICKMRQPQFFRILGDARLHHLLNRSNFPILHAVASCLRADLSRSATQFVPTMNRVHGVVRELCDIHKAANLQVQNARFR